MTDEPIVQEVRRIREEYAARFKYDLQAIFADLKRSEAVRDQRQAPGGAGAFDSGHSETGERAEEALGELGFATESGR
jgi:hypothetical protein